MKVKIKIPANYYRILAAMMNQLTIDNSGYNNFIISQSKQAAFCEMRQIFIDVARKHQESSRSVTVKIPDSYCLLFFGSFYGLRMEGFLNVVIKEICKQIEEQLFKSGKYKLTV